MTDIPESLARQLLAEYKDIYQTRFWEYLMKGYEEERQRAKDAWESTEQGTAGSPLMQKWIRLQGRAKAFKDAQAIPGRKIQELRKILGMEK